MYMSVLYRSIYPQSQQSEYLGNQNSDFYLNIQGEKYVPGTAKLEGLCGVYADLANLTPVAADEDIHYDPTSGYHGLCRDITTEFENQGVVENLQNYPRLVHEERMCTDAIESFGTETRNTVEGCLPNIGTVAGSLEGLGGKLGSKIPFSIPLRICLNAASAPISGNVTGQIRLRIRWAPNDEFLCGTEYVSGTSGYSLSDVKLTYQVIPDDGKREPVQMEVYSSYRINVDSNDMNISTFVPGLCDAVHMSFIKIADETTPTKNFLACQPVPGQPPLGYSDVGVTIDNYGIERLYYAINDTDTALVGFTMESREEIMRNGIRSFNPAVDRYATLARRLREQEQDGYVAGIPFGGLVDFTKNKFAVNIKSQCSNANQYACYLHFRQRQELMA